MDGVTGRLGSTSADDLAAKLREVIAEIGKSDAMSHAAKKRAYEEFSSEVMAQAHADLYRKVLNQDIR
jgi:glycosyltransferase involved in cell wall biosynthesis